MLKNFSKTKDSRFGSSRKPAKSLFHPNRLIKPRSKEDVAIQPDLLDLSGFELPKRKSAQNLSPKINSKKFAALGFKMALIDSFSNFFREKKLLKKASKFQKSSKSIEARLQKESGGFLRNFSKKILLTAALANLFFLSNSAIQQYLEFAKQNRSEAALIVKRISAEFGDFLSYSELLLNSVTANFVWNKMDNNEIPESLARFEKFRHRSFSKETLSGEGILYWIDANKYLVASSIGKIKKPINLTGRDYLKNCEEVPGKLQVGRPVIGALSSQLVLPVAVGLVGNNGRYLGTSVLSVQVEDVVKNLAKLDDRNFGEFAIVGLDKKILIESKKEFFGSNGRFLRIMKQLDLSLDMPESETEVNSLFMAIKRKQNFFVKSRVANQDFVVFYAVSGKKLHQQLLQKLELVGVEALFSILIILLVLF